jgi:hypothetical protein
VTVRCQPEEARAALMLSPTQTSKTKPHSEEELLGQESKIHMTRIRAEKEKTQTKGRKDTARAQSVGDLF